MKIARTIGLVMLIVAMVSSMGFAKAHKSAITNSKHDMRTAYGGLSFTLCNFCHVAHKPGATVSAPASTGALLWNHTLSNVTSYGVYSSDTFNGYNTDIQDLGAGNTGTLTVSNMCLSCHDGTIAINSWYEPPTGTHGNANFMPDGEVIKNLAQTHPVNFTYNADLATKAGLLQPANAQSVDGAGEIPLFNGRMQCATCHDPHNGASAIFEQNFPTQSSGSFCTYCHL